MTWCIRIIGRGITGRHYSRCASKSLYFKSRIIGKAVQTIFAVDPSCFYESITLKGFRCLFNVIMTAYVVERKYFTSAISGSIQNFKNGTGFLQFVSVVGGEYYSFR